MERTPAGLIGIGDHRECFMRERDALIEAHLKLVPPIARRVKKLLPPSFDLDDLISEGHVGLTQAATRYRSEQHNGTPFSAFARPRIHGAMVDSVRRRAWIENTANPLEDAPEPVDTPVLPFLIGGSEEPVLRRGRPVALRPARLPKRLAAALRRLPVRQRAILGAFYAEDWSVGQIAELLGLTPAQVAAEHRSALDFLHAALVQNLSISGSTLVFFMERAA
jgi:RNA polymerase sigma factor for flagellar operon FliA